MLKIGFKRCLLVCLYDHLGNLKCLLRKVSHLNSFAIFSNEKATVINGSTLLLLIFFHLNTLFSCTTMVGTQELTKRGLRCTKI